MIISEAVINHLPSDREVAIDAAHIQLFALNHCKLIATDTIEYYHNENLHSMECEIKGNN